MVLEDGWVTVGGDNARRLSFEELYAQEGSLRVEGHHEIDLRPDPLTGYGHYAATYGFGAQAVEVEVDPTTGHVRVVKVIVVQDIGRVINPLTLEGQMHGGIVQGIGMALNENSCLTTDNPSMQRWSITACRASWKRRKSSVALETDDPTGPTGGLVQHSINPAAAISNAVSDATGLFLTKLPMTPQRILAGLTQRAKSTPAAGAPLTLRWPQSARCGTVFPLAKKLAPNSQGAQKSSLLTHVRSP